MPASRKEYFKKYYAKPENIERIRKYRLNWQRNNRDKMHKYHKKYRETHQEYEKKRRRDFFERNRNFKLDYKKDKCCVICGWKEHPEILHFHHTGKKSFDIADRNTYKAETTLKEIARCILICPNCHGWIHFPKRTSQEEAEKK